MTNEDLIARGYKRFKPSPLYNDCITDLLQKCFSDSHGKKYFINANRWDFSRYNDANHKYEPQYEYDVQLYRKETGDAVDVSFHNSWSIEDVEEWVEWLFQSGRFKYYEEWERE